MLLDKVIMIMYTQQSCWCMNEATSALSLLFCLWLLNRVLFRAQRLTLISFSPFGNNKISWFVQPCLKYPSVCILFHFLYDKLYGSHTAKEVKLHDWLKKDGFKQNVIPWDLFNLIILAPEMKRCLFKGSHILFSFGLSREKMAKMPAVTK